LLRITRIRTLLIARMNWKTAAETTSPGRRILPLAPRKTFCRYSDLRRIVRSYGEA
jgi:hypothetical protein